MGLIETSILQSGGAKLIQTATNPILGAAYAFYEDCVLLNPHTRVVQETPCRAIVLSTR